MRIVDMKTGRESTSMKVPPKRKGNSGHGSELIRGKKTSMKVPPKRKGNRARPDRSLRREYRPQ